MVAFVILMVALMMATGDVVMAVAAVAMAVAAVVMAVAAVAMAVAAVVMAVAAVVMAVAAVVVAVAYVVFKGAEHGFVDQDLVRHGENKADKKKKRLRAPESGNIRAALQEKYLKNNYIAHWQRSGTDHFDILLLSRPKAVNTKLCSSIQIRICNTVYNKGRIKFTKQKKDFLCH